MSDSCKLLIRDVRKSYGAVAAVAGVSLEVRAGEFMTLLGPSGSGKTTLLSMIAGLTWPDSGEIWIDGDLSTYKDPSKRDIGMVFQNYALFPHLSVYENIAFPLRMRQTAESDLRRQVLHALDLVQLSGMAERLPSALSGGQQQRVALARSIVYRPSVILMDEPLGALDKRLRDQMKIEIKRLHGELGITVIYVTHDQEEAMVMSDRICLFRDARIEQRGTPRDLYFKPETKFAATFLGESNILDVERIGSSGATVRLRTASGAMVSAEAPASLNTNQPLCLMVRPEFLAVLTARETAENELSGVVRDIVLTGGVTKWLIEADGGVPLVATRLTTSNSDAAAPGSAVRVGWHTACGVLLPSEPVAQA